MRRPDPALPLAALVLALGVAGLVWLARTPGTSTMEARIGALESGEAAVRGAGTLQVWASGRPPENWAFGAGLEPSLPGGPLAVLWAGPAGGRAQVLALGSGGETLQTDALEPAVELRLVPPSGATALRFTTQTDAGPVHLRIWLEDVP